MLKSYTSEEENIPYLRKLAKNIIEQQRASQAVWRYRWLACVLIALQVVRTSSPGSRPRQLFRPLEEILLQPVRKSFVSVFVQNIVSRGLENNLTRAPLLGLAKSIYYYYQLRVSQLRQNFFARLSWPEASCVTFYVTCMNWLRNAWL